MSPTPNEPIAVIGSACRFPGDSTSTSKLWELLRNPRDVLSKIPKGRFNVDAFHHQDGAHHGTMNVSDSYFLSEDISRFDTQFFGIKPVEARAIDPQHRLLLETVYEGLETAGIPVEKLGGSNTGMFVGQMCEDWTPHLQRDGDQLPVYTATGTARSITSNRVSYFFDWHGPSVTIDTACSSSLVAVHQAVQSLRSQESSVAVAAGVNLIITPEMYVAETKLKMLSPTGRSRMWDVDADGYARGEGVASLVLKTLSDAIRDGDQIEYLIRETAINADGRTAQGLTMPSNVAQTELIRTAYRKAGLDLDNEDDRCQYFEAHGTGTQAGDPQESQAIHNAFFGPGRRDGHKKLYVGSIKTVIGHTEGTAGVAGMIKAGLALRSGTILPNMHFNKLSPRVAPYYGNLEIATKPTSWPKLGPNGVRRASVNSFGFGGSNAHAILEAYTPSSAKEASQADIPEKKRLFTFSAHSRSSLLQTLQNYQHYVETLRPSDMANLSHTLLERRSELQYRTTIAASTPEDLATKLGNAYEEASKASELTLGTRSLGKSARIIGVFTGQGAQWAAMGNDLIRQYPIVWQTLTDLDKSLSTLPVEDRPSWKIVDELLGTETSSTSIHEADRSQPLCTAVQIALVDLLKAIGVTFEAVVGHSSGEIGAAYASGFHDAKEAIRIAYYRGLCVKRANAARTIRGAMMAVGTSFEDATELCELEEFEGRIRVAASNAPASVTISGDADAIDEAQIVLEDEKKFARKLKVDTAYHSHHMQVCGDPYVSCLRACGIKVLPGSKDCSWYSSVSEGDKMEAVESLSGEYWRENMVCPVLFSQAVTSAIIEHDDANAIVELGPHPALQGPATQTIQEVLNNATLPYTGVLSRGKNSAESFLSAVGFLWSTFGRSSFNISALQELADPNADQPTLLTSLPVYAWDHSQQYWTDSRSSRAFTARTDPVHELLGVKQVASTGEIRWKNILQVRELPWVVGHRLEGQVVFPAAAYIVSVLEGARTLGNGRPIKLITIEDFTIGRAITLDEEDEKGVEIQLSFTDALQRQSNDSAVVDFRYCSSFNPDADIMTENASGRLTVEFGEPVPDLLPERSKKPPNLADVGQDLFYTCLAELGYQYDGSFRCLSSLTRVMGNTRAKVDYDPVETPGPQFLIHPAPLDAAIQSLLLAFCWPGDGKLRSLHVPTGIKRISFNPYFALCDSSKPSSLPCDAEVVDETSAVKFGGDVQIFPEEGSNAAVQLEGLEVQPFAPYTEANDREAFSTWDWQIAGADGLRATTFAPSEEDKIVAKTTEKAAVYFLKHLKSVITPEELEKSEWHFKRVFDFADHVLNGVADGTRPYSEKSWLDTTKEEIYAELNKYPESLDVRLIKAVGENLPNAVRGKTQILEHMLEDDLLNDFYVDGRGIYETTIFAANMVQQITHRYGELGIIEIGAGTGATTKRILGTIKQTYKSYMYTDISTGFFEKAQETFSNHSKKMSFKTLDIEQDIEEQGYTPHSYDMVVANSVIHATKSLKTSLDNVRRLLKPGGFFVLVELTDITEAIRIFVTMAGLPGFWIGYDDGRILSPAASPERWDMELKNTGFSGVDTITSMDYKLERPSYALISRAIDDRITYIEKPLALPSSSLLPEEVVILGGVKPETKRLVDESASLLGSCGVKTRNFASLEEAVDATLSDKSVMLSYLDMDEPIFKNFSNEKLEGLKRLVGCTRILLWVTTGRQSHDPYSNMTIGFARTLTREVPTLMAQFFDMEELETPPVRLIVEQLLRVDGARKVHADPSQDPILYSEEREVLYRNAEIYIPRLRYCTEANQRMNSSKRLIKKERNIRKDIVELTSTATGYDTTQVTPLALLKRDLTKRSDIHVSHSSLLAVQIAPNAHRYIVYGTEVDSGRKVIALAAQNASRVSVEPGLIVPAEVALGKEASVVHSVLAELLVAYITSDAFGDNPIHIHGADAGTIKLTSQWGRERGVELTFSTSRPGHGIPGVEFIHSQWTKKTVASKIPRDVGCFINLDHEVAISSLKEALPPRCQVVDADELLQKSPARFGRDNTEIGGLLKASVKKYSLSPLSSAVDSFPIETLKESGAGANKLAVVDWTAETIQATIEPIDARQLFSIDKTYALFGLTSDLAQSLCVWMIQHGAKYVVLTSRNPRIEDAWFSLVKSMGATVKVYASDLTNEQDFKRVYDDIVATLPPVGGVVNGAMVLDDEMIEDMTIEAWEKACRPKVRGSVFLDKYFNTELEFFILFSSIVATHGNEGQANYGAGNMFSTGLAFNRRLRGLRASVLHIGPIAGAGYIIREATHIVENRVLGRGHMLLSQTDFFTAFAETMLRGRPELNLSPEIVLNERRFTGEDGLTEDPRYQFTLPKGFGEDDGATGKSGGASVRSQLADCANMEEVFEVVQDGFAIKLAALLQATISDQWKEDALDTPANDFGVDSLIAVDIRTWFIRELDVDCPVLKILGGATIRELVEFAVSKLSEEMLPNLGGESRPKPVPEEPAEPKAKAPLEDTKATPTEKPSASTVQAPSPPAAAQPLPANPAKFTKSILQETTAASSAAYSTRTPSPVQSVDEPSGSQSPNLSETDSSASASGESGVKLSYVTSTGPKSIVRTQELSPAQLRLHTLVSLLDNSVPLNIGSFTKLDGLLRVDDFIDAINKVGLRHEAIRTCYYVENEVPVQGILAEPRITIEQGTVSDEASAKAKFDQMNNHVFDLANGDCLRVAILRQSANVHFVLFVYNHLVMDGASYEVFLADLAQVYSGVTLSNKVLQFPDFAKRQLAELKSGQYNDQLDFWKKELAQMPETLPLLPFAETRNREVLDVYDFNRVSHTNSKALTTRIKLATQKIKASPFHFYFAAFKVLLSRLLQIDEMCIGIADANRNDKDTMNSVGNYLNLLPVVLSTARSEEFTNIVQEVRTKTLSALANSNLPFDTLLEELEISRSASYSPLFQAFINYRSGVQEKRPFGEAEAELLGFTVSKTGYDITLDIVDNPGGEATISFMVQKYLYSEADAAVLMDIFVRLLEGLAKSPTGSATTPSLYSKQDLQQAVELGRGKVTPPADVPTLVHRVDHYIEQTPQAQALKDSAGAQLTYAEMSKRIDAIAAALSSKGLPAGSKVATYQSPTVDWICSMLATMRLGFTYLPLDPRFPTARLQAIINDCNPAVVIINHTTRDDASRLGVPESNIITVAETQAPAQRVPNVATPDTIAALLYTSGSTGIPKGTILKHAGLLNEIEDSTEVFDLGPKDRVLQQAAISFDLSLWQAFDGIANGGMTVVACKEHRFDPAIMSSLLRKEAVTVSLATPSEYISWIRDGSAAEIRESPLRIAAAVGEMVTRAHSNEILGLQKPGLRLFNGYGPSETSFVISKTELYPSNVKKGRKVRNPVGFSTRNCSVYVVDSDLQLLPAGFSGEILIGGAGVAAGYYNNDALTGEKFLNDPHASPDQVKRGWTRMYRSGDRGFLGEDGRLTVESRIMGDTEVKLRGIRIDVQDVEKAIVQTSNGAIREAIVSARGNPQFLVAHLVFGPNIPEDQRRKFYIGLVARLPLPQYMCPAVGIPLEALPINNNGKVDRAAVAALPIRDSKDAKSDAETNSQLSTTELTLKKLWLDVLPPGSCEPSDITAESDFFYVGGNSGLIVQLQREIRGNFNVAIPFVHLFETSTLQTMAAKIEGQSVQSSIDWTDETAVSGDAIKAESHALIKHAQVSKGPGSVVLITGATGNFGSAVLPALASNKNVSKIYSVGVRSMTNARDALEKLALPSDQLSKIKLQSGDLTRPRLGLSDIEYANIMAEADSIIHLAAARSFWDDYQTLRQVNVNSVRELLVISAARKIPIHFMSSGGVTRYESAKQSPPVDGSDGYISTKWAAEQILDNAKGELGIPVTIYRTLATKATAAAATKTEALDTFVQYAKAISALPIEEYWSGHMDLLKLRPLAQAVANNVVANEAAGYVNYDAEVKVDTKEISQYANSRLSQNDINTLKRISALEWIGMVKRSGFPYLLAAQNVTFNNGDHGSNLSVVR